MVVDNRPDVVAPSKTPRLTQIGQQFGDNSHTACCKQNHAYHDAPVPCYGGWQPQPKAVGGTTIVEDNPAS